MYVCIYIIYVQIYLHIFVRVETSPSWATLILTPRYNMTAAFGYIGASLKRALNIHQYYYYTRQCYFPLRLSAVQLQNTVPTSCVETILQKYIYCHFNTHIFL